MSLWPSLADFFPPTRQAYEVVRTIFCIWPVLGVIQFYSPSTPMGKTSLTTRFNLNGRYAWAVSELVGPINLIYVLYSLPGKLPPLNRADPGTPSSGVFGTGLPITHEILGMLYVLHYINRAIITPIFKAPSVSPILAPVALMMALHQWINSSQLAGWICYDAQDRAQVLSDQKVDAALLSPLAILGTVFFVAGLAGNITAEWHLFEIRKQAAKRKAKSEGKAKITYDKVYVVPEAKGLYKYVMFPHYSLEWLEWTGYWLMAGAYGLGFGIWKSGAILFVMAEFANMTPRAIDGVRWYEKKFGKRAVAGRIAVIPGLI